VARYGAGLQYIWGRYGSALSWPRMYLRRRGGQDAGCPGGPSRRQLALARSCAYSRRWHGGSCRVGRTTIEWVDTGCNPVGGWIEVSPGRARCDAETFAGRSRGGPGHPYGRGFDLRLVPERRAEPLGWERPRMVVVDSMSDRFRPGVLDDSVDRVVPTLRRADRHTSRVLRRRTGRLRDLPRDRATDGDGERPGCEAGPPDCPRGSVCPRREGRRTAGVVAAIRRGPAGPGRTAAGRERCVRRPPPCPN
jgi:hypothetical protein